MERVYVYDVVVCANGMRSNDVFVVVCENVMRTSNNVFVVACDLFFSQLEALLFAEGTLMELDFFCGVLFLCLCDGPLVSENGSNASVAEVVLRTSYVFGDETSSWIVTKTVGGGEENETCVGLLLCGWPTGVAMERVLVGVGVVVELCCDSCVVEVCVVVVTTKVVVVVSFSGVEGWYQLVLASRFVGLHWVVLFFQQVSALQSS
eukprot:TRINITY_DN51879_c0_g3_i1.p2 TRINITY_DN51879_c0_g3~~TRINITY_DN51879_c0_g3_i1.p2  ORF type:complete len:206 (+),score=11.78 TRINITY_DN51879_c0_g3_i1:524-1141(+)